MLYAYVRIKGIQRKAVESLHASPSSGAEEINSDITISLKQPEELALAKHMMRFQEILREIESDLYPNKVTHNYIYFVSFESIVILHIIVMRVSF